MHLKRILGGRLTIFEFAYPRGRHRQWVGGVEASLPIINWPSIPKDGDFKVLHHGVHNLPAETALIRRSVKKSVISFEQFSHTAYLFTRRGHFSGLMSTSYR